MKATILSGLVALALGAFTTSCSNILEENGVLNSAAQSGMGELCINLTTDASLNVSTKSGEGEEDLSTSYESLKGDFEVTLTAPTGTTVAEGTLPTKAKYSEIENKTYTLPAANGYTLTAKYGEMREDFGWNCPIFEGTNDQINVTANNSTPAKVTCTLQNAIINVDLSELETENSKVEVTSLYATSGANGETKFYMKGASVDNGKELGKDTVYVKANVTANLVLEGTFKSTESSEPISFTTPATPIRPADASEVTQTKAKTKYNVKYTLSDSKGQITIGVVIDGKVTPVTINTQIDPYYNTNSGS